jgi:glycosyltransferase involved in cell wall biosynthesis
MPLSILEAQASRVPVLAAPTSGIPEIVTDGQTGFLIAPIHVNHYAERMKLLLDDPTLAHKLADNAYSKILHMHTFQSYINFIWTLYQNLIKHK